MNALRDSGGYDVRRHHLHHPARTHFTSSVASRLAATTGALVCRSHGSREPRDKRGGGGRGGQVTWPPVDPSRWRRERQRSWLTRRWRPLVTRPAMTDLPPHTPLICIQLCREAVTSPNLHTAAVAGNRWGTAAAGVVFPGRLSATLPANRLAHTRACVNIGCSWWWASLVRTSLPWLLSSRPIRYVIFFCFQ